MSKLRDSSQKTVCLIGGGLAGLSAAVFFDSVGFKVSLYEKKALLGGRTFAFQDKKTNCWVDNGQHLMMGAYHETIRFLEMIGAKRHLLFQKQMEVPLVSPQGDFFCFRLPQIKSPLNLLWGIFNFDPFSLKDKWAAIKLGNQLRKYELHSPFFNKTVHDWLDETRQSANARHYLWDMITYATLNDSPQVASARLLACVLKRGLMGARGDSRLVIPKENLNETIGNPAKTYLELRGHSLNLSKRVSKIHILDNQVRALELEDGTLVKADLYVSAVPPRQLLRLIPEGFIESEDYFQKITRLKTSPIVSVNLWFDREFMEWPFAGLVQSPLHWIFNKNRISDVTHPPYHYMGVLSGAHDYLNQSGDEIKKMVLEELTRYFPQVGKAHLIHSLVNIEREATLLPTVESEELRPNQQSPFENFLVIGDWTQTGLPATIESAVVSAKRAGDLAIKNPQ